MENGNGPSSSEMMSQQNNTEKMLLLRKLYKMPEMKVRPHLRQ